jgi:hypothetical protein
MLRQPISGFYDVPRAVRKAPGPPREWRFTDAEKRAWKAIVDLQPAADKTGTYQMAIRLERAGA